MLAALISLAVALVAFRLYLSSPQYLAWLPVAAAVTAAFAGFGFALTAIFP